MIKKHYRLILSLYVATKVCTVVYCVPPVYQDEWYKVDSNFQEQPDDNAHSLVPTGLGNSSVHAHNSHPVAFNIHTKDFPLETNPKLPIIDSSRFCLGNEDDFNEFQNPSLVRMYFSGGSSASANGAFNSSISGCTFTDRNLNRPLSKLID